MNKASSDISSNTSANLLWIVQSNLGDSAVIKFTEKMAARWSPAPVFVMDVAACAGALYVLEINGFNSSGFYACDIETIVREVSAYALSGH
ncbi:hypothetical protein HCH_04670 [Hahella chejuensis KCTC 2396]|uniref:ATP-grasp domain-containing protein n=1 Tax=Hahella chejuensis (strain KCTC 2396) TaxID=349521 RepID=Q2SDA5_HAHCH|nr:ATP-grasp domain-containing protein [Hahella chejuensis]ABC31369.1 hypothetical protein HCH_04670 [Hahella chejuensis KCTC 2396]